MASLTEAVQSTSAPRALSAMTERKIRPVLWWAALGVFLAGVAVFSMNSWISSPDFTRTPTGASPVPDFMRWNAYISQALGPIAAIPVVYFVLIRPWRRQGHISLDGTLLRAFWGVWWIEPIGNFSHPLTPTIRCL